MKIYSKLLSTFSLIFLLTACIEKEEDPTNSSTGTGTGSTADSLIPLDTIEASSDYTFDLTTANTIKLNGGSIAVTGSGTKVVGTVVTVTAAGTYLVSGNLSNGQIVVQTDATDAVKLILNGVDIASSVSSPVFIDKAKKVVLCLPKGSVNKVSDAATYTNVTEGQNAAIYSQAYLAITGEGSLEVKGNFEDGIGGKDGLVINGGNISVTAKDEGIRGKDYLVVRQGNFMVTTTSGDGFKSDYDQDPTYGYILIDKGTFKVTSQGDAFTAKSTLTVKAGTFDITSGGGSSKTVATGVSAKGFKAPGLLRLAVTSANFSTADDAINGNTEVVIESGNYDISSADDGIHANATVTIKGGKINITKCFEGIESKTINVENGTISVVSTNDSFNATAGTDAQQNDGSMINIKGGTFILDGQNGDPLDSNGGIAMENGLVVIHGPAGGEVPIDYNTTFAVTKGFIVASGSNSRMLRTPSASATINTLKVLFNTPLTANTPISIVDDGGQVVATFKPLKTYATLVLTSDKLLKDKKYSVYTGGTPSGSNVGGYYTTPCAGATLRGTFTVSAAITNVTI